ncbi:class I SAM-dependent methyltransferase [Paludisphaera sp.]|uniref:class I SAM-dependent methyltransferase n=1 Tax=Paludisphaera sp. TaxID=2017432 RepID=UPI00301E3306
MSMIGSTPRRTRAARAGWPVPADHRAEAALIRELWARQREADGSMDDDERRYLDAHLASPLTLRRRLAMVDWLAAGIRPGDRVLEWGCRHGVDSCVYRRRFGPSLDLHGCDFVAADDYRPFFEYSGLKYAQLTDHIRLDYPDACFDVVTSNGVWEHVWKEEESLREVFRVLRPGGSFLVACLPNRYSYTEAVQRKLGHSAHDRLYTIASARALLDAAGFELLTWERRLLVPTMLNGFPRPLKAAYGRCHGLVWALNGVLERTWPLGLLASNLNIVARRPAEG